MKDGRYPEAEQVLGKAAELNPNDGLAWVSLAESCRRNNDIAKAGEAAERAAEVAPDNPIVEHALSLFYAATGSLKLAGQWEEKYAATPKADAGAVLRAGDLYLRAGAVADAERALHAGWQQRNTDPAMSFEYAKLLLQKLDFEGAKNVAAGALKAHPKDAQLLLLSGVASYGERRFDEAINDFLGVIRVDPAIPQPYQFLGRMLEHAGPHLPELTAAFERRVAQTPNDPVPHIVLAKALLAANPNDPRAETLLRDSIQVDGAQWEAHYELGVLMEGRHKYTDAVDELNKAVGLSPKQAMSHYHLARVYDRLGQPDKAKAERQLHEELAEARTESR